MRKALAATGIAALTLIPATSAFAQQTPSDPNNMQQIDNPVDTNNNNKGGHDWGLLGLAGLLGLGGLAGRRKKVDTTTSDRIGTATADTRGY